MSTYLGLFIAKIFGGPIIQLDSKVFINYGRKGKYLKSTAITIGDVILAKGNMSNSVISHELRHSNQYAYLGLLLFPLYGLSSLYSYVRYHNPWQGNIFEIRAGLEDGEYV